MIYDAVIVGCGLSGLGAGIRLALFDKKVLIVEKHTVIGGLNSFYSRKGRLIDVGLHAMTNYSPKGVRSSPLGKLLKQLRFSHDDFRLCQQSMSEIRFPENSLRFTNDFAFFEQEVAEQFPDQFVQPECTVKAIKAERTFWEKATILHHEAYRPDDSMQPPRNSRHYYDMFQMANAPVKDSALADLALLESVVAFKQRFYPRGWARYDLARPGTLRLVPEGHVQDVLKADYRAMRIMIYGEYPEFESILSTLQGLEDEINRLS